MPAADTSGTGALRPPPRKKKRQPTPAPPRRPAPVFGGPATSTRPLAPQQEQQQQKVDRSRSRLPRAPIAAPPIIHNPTVSQVRAAKAQLVHSVRSAVGTGGTTAERSARRDALLHDIGTDPRYAAARRSIAHWTAAEQQLVTPARAAMNARDRVTPGPAPTRARIGVGPLNLGTVNLTAAGGALAAEVAKATPGLQSGSAPARLVRNSVRDLGTLGKAPFVGGYAAGKAIVTDVAHMTAHPTALSHGYKPESEKLVGGILGGIADEVKHPGKAFSEHPLLTTLDALGALSAVGRTAGAGARAVGSTPDATGVRGAAARAGSTVRPPLALTGDVAGGIVTRRYSKDATRKAAQVAEDKALHEPLLHPDGSPVTVRDGGREVPVLAPSSELGRKHLANRRADMLAGRANAQERLVREREAGARTVSTPAGAAVRNAIGEHRPSLLPSYEGEPVHGISGRATRNIVAMAVEGTIIGAAHLADDLRAHVARLDREYNARIGTKGFRHSQEARTNRQRRALAQKVLDSPKALAQAKAIVSEAERHGRALNAADVQKAAAGIDEAPRLRRAALETPALEHMGARHFSVEEHKALEREARGAEKAARDAYAAAKTPGARQAALDVVNAAREHRIAVSGRHPEGVRAHEAARASLADARDRLQRAETELPHAQARVRGLAQAHASQRAREAQQGPVAAFYVGRQRFTTREAAVAHARAHDFPLRDIKRIATTASESKRVGDLSQARRAVKAIRERRRRAEQSLRAAERAVRENPLPETRAAIRYGEDSAHLGKRPGEFLSNADIEAFLKSRGRDPGTVAYLPHRGDTVGRRAYHRQLRPGTRPRDAAEARTGSAYIKGAVHATAKLLREQGVRQQVQIANANAIDRVIGEHGMRHPAFTKAERGKALNGYETRVVNEGGLFTAKEALETAERLMHDRGEYVVAVRAHAAQLSEDTRRVIRDDLQGPGGMDSLGQRMLNDRVVTDGELGDKTRNIVLMSGHLFDRLNAHLRPAGPFQKFAQVLNRAFRYAVLPQPRWLAGNFMEPYIIRLTVKGSGVNVFGLGLDIAKSRALFKRMKRSGDPRVRAAAAELEAHGLGGLFLGQRGLENRRALEDFPTLDGTAQRAYGKVVSKLPAVESFGDITGTLLKAGAKTVLAPLKLFFTFNRGIERGAQHAAVGGFIRDELQSFTGKWWQTIKTGEQAWKDAQQGLVGTPAQHRLMDEAHEVLGKYDSYSPTMRAIIQGPAPFLPWMLNAVRFVYWTMPVGHTVLSSLLIKTAQVVEKDWQDLHADLPPGSLRQAIPNGNGGWIDLARYGPYGATVPLVEGDLRGITSQYLPQISGAESAIEGRDPFGRPLQVKPTASNPSGEPSAGQKILIALNALAEAHTPYLSTARRLQEHGETAYADSTLISPKTKPGTSHGMSAFRRVFDPLRPTYLTATEEPAPAPVASEPTRRETLLQRRADLLAGRAGSSARMQALLERRARLLGQR